LAGGFRGIGLPCLAGPAAAALAWVVIGVSWYMNPWFVFTRDAFSDFGGPGASNPWVYNYGLMATALLVAVYSACLYRWAESKLEVFGSALLFVAALFLALIGYYPSGTRPHTFVSWWFFAQMDMALIALGAGMSRRPGREGAYGRYVLGLAVAGPIVFLLAEALVGWPSAAVAEAYGILVIDACVALILLAQLSGRQY